MSSTLAHGQCEQAALFGLSQGRASFDGRPVDVSVVTPMRDEEGAAAQLVEEIARALAGRRFEILAVDDASRDGTTDRLRDSQARVPELRLLRHERNAGQSRAVRTGVLAARGSIIVTLDGDGQNDPADIPLLLEKLDGATSPTLMMVAGERSKRLDGFRKKAASRIANRIRSRLLKDGASDTGCGLKAFRREAYLRLPYFDHCHRYLPALMRREGYDVAFVAVSHRARSHGTSKYTNFGRLGVAFRDMLGVMWLIGRARSPERVFELSHSSERDTI